MVFDEATLEPSMNAVTITPSAFLPSTVTVPANLWIETLWPLTAAGKASAKKTDMRIIFRKFVGIFKHWEGWFSRWTYAFWSDSSYSYELYFDKNFGIGAGKSSKWLSSFVRYYSRRTSMLLAASKSGTLLLAANIIGTIGDGDHKMSGVEANYTGIIDGTYSSNNWLLIRNNIFANLPVVQ